LAPLRSLDAKGAAIALLLAALWAGNPIAVKIGLADAPPLRLAAMRFVIGGMSIFAYAWWIRRQRRFPIYPGEWPVLWSLALLFAVQIGLMNYGLNLTSASHGAILVNTFAVHTVVLAHFLIPGDRMTAAKLGGTAVAYLGIVVLFARDVATRPATLLGDLIVSASAILLAERIVYMARAVQRVDPVKLLLFQSAIGSACFLLVSLWWEWGDPFRATVPLALSLAYQGVVVAGFNFVVNAWLLQRYRPSALAVTSLTSPIWGVLLASAVVGDPLTLTVLLSSALVAAGVGVAARK
jgi:drug/metabolite transporter (DMT)-like permease